MRKRNLILFVVFLLVAIGVILGVWFGLLKQQQGTIFNPLPELKIQVVYATEEGEWIRAAAEQFNREEHVINGQRIRVELSPMDSVEALYQIQEGKIQPTAWSPASMLWVNMLNDTWNVEHGVDLVMRVGQYQATPLVLSPMVFVMWEDRAQPFTRYFSSTLGVGDVDWDTIQQAVVAPEGWRTLGGDPNWGQVKFGQADPLYSNSGLVAISLATYDYLDKTRGLVIEDLNNSRYKAWLSSLWKSVVGRYATASADLMKDMLLYCSSTYDVIMVYESLVASQLKNVTGRCGTDLRIFYPRLNLWSDHPFAVLMADWSTADQKDAALEFQKYLLSEPIQQKALHYGFRPANVDVPIVNSDPENPFNKYQNQGLRVQIPRPNLVEVPSADVIQELQRIFRQQQP